MKATLFFILLVVSLVLASCPNNCNNHGSCSGGSCVCNSGWGGSDCSISDTGIESGEVVTGHLDTFEWKYFHINIASGTNGLSIAVDQTSDFGDIDLFVSRNSYPTTQNYEYTDTSTNSHLTVDISPVATGTWYIGLYGYWSADFRLSVEAQTGCTVDCGDYGYCSINVCSCYVPYSGEDCSIFNQHLVSGQSEFNSVETNTWKYYNIDVEDGESLYITVTQDNASYDVDVYVQIENLPTSRSFLYLNATTSPTTYLHLDNLAGGLYEIGIYGYRGGNFEIEASVYESSTASCQNDCSNHGSCSHGTCTCSNNYSGDYCGRYDLDMEIGDSYDGFVDNGKWNYWTFHYFTSSPLRVTVTQTGSGDCDLYIRQNNDPTRIQYQYSDISLDSEYSIVVQEPGDETWHIGVYGWITCSYDISVDFVDECQCIDENHGTCPQGSNECTCFLDYAGANCEIPTLSIASGAVLSGSNVVHSWDYYHFTSDASIVIITMVETSTEGDLFLTLSLSGYPSGENWEYYDITDSAYHEIELTWETRTPRTYFIGVVSSTTSVATEPVNYQITAFGSPF